MFKLSTDHQLQVWTFFLSFSPLLANHFFSSNCLLADAISVLLLFGAKSFSESQGRGSDKQADHTLQGGVLFISSSQKPYPNPSFNLLGSSISQCALFVLNVHIRDHFQVSKNCRFVICLVIQTFPCTVFFIFLFLLFLYWSYILFFIPLAEKKKTYDIIVVVSPSS